MNGRFQAVVIGGGVIGCAIAFFLARAGRRVVVLEKGVVGAEGSTRFSGGIVRAYDPDPTLSLLSSRGLRLFHEWESLGLPGRIPIRRSGCLYLSRMACESKLDSTVDGLAAAGHRVSVLSPSAVRNHFTFVRAGHPGWGIFELDGGYGDPRLTSRLLASGIQSRGGAVFEHCEVEVCEQNATSLWTIRCGVTSFVSEAIIVAAGRQTVRFASSSALQAKTIPLTQVYSEQVRIDIPVVDECSDTYVRPIENGGFYCGSKATRNVNADKEPPAYGDEQRRDSLERLAGLIGVDKQVTPIVGIQGFDTYTADNRPLLGFLPARGLYIASGFSGRGYKYALAVGEAAAQAVNIEMGWRRGPQSDDMVDLAAFRPDTAPARHWNSLSG